MLGAGAAGSLVWADGIDEATGDIFAQGLSAFDRKDYDAAIDTFEQALTYEPDNAEYTHWLARAYGRKAERSKWFRAIALAARTRDTLVKAFMLDPARLETIDDLIQFYLEAPAFLGGSTEKAARLRLHRDQIERGATGTFHLSLQEERAVPAAPGNEPAPMQYPRGDKPDIRELD